MLSQMVRDLWRKNFALTVLPIAIATVAVPKAQAAIFTYSAGSQDNFSGIEAAAPSDGLIQFHRSIFDTNLGNGFCDRFQSRCEVRDFDRIATDRNFMHTINLDPSIGEITAAQLEIRVRGDGSGLNFNDTISLFFVDENGNGDPRRWGRQIGTGGGVEGLLPTAWQQGEVQTFTFDLANLPLPSNSNPTALASNLLATLQEKQFVDIYVQDDTSVDYVSLTVETKSIPEPSSALGIVALGTIGLATLKRKPGRKDSEIGG